jgi:hypothetical protein
MKVNARQWAKTLPQSTISPCGYACITLVVHRMTGDFAALPSNMIISIGNCKKCLQSKLQASRLCLTVWKQTHKRQNHVYAYGNQKHYG